MTYNRTGTSANFVGTPVRKVCLTIMSDPSVKEIFLSRVRSFLEVLMSSCNSGDEESLEHDFDYLYTRANLLYHHGVRLASVRSNYSNYPECLV